jgi:pilus assembly protein CpaE
VVRVFIANASPAEREEIIGHLAADPDAQVVGQAGDATAALAAARDLQPDVVITDIDLPLGAAAQDRAAGGDAPGGVLLTEALAEEAPAASVVMLSSHREFVELRRAMQAGARDFLAKPIRGDDLTTSIHRVYEMEVQRRFRLAELAGAPLTPSEATDGKIITMFSPKGGVGRTTIGVNLSVALRQLTMKRVVIADCNLQFGDVGIVMNVNSSRTIAELISSVGDLTPQVLDSVLVDHESGVRALLAPARPEVAELFHPEHIKQILHALRQQNEYVVVDTWTSFQEVILGIFDASNEIVLLTTLDMPSVKNIRIFLDVCEAIQYPKDHIHLVLNRADSNSGLRLEDIEESIQHKVASTIVSAGTLVTASINRGRPFLLSDPGAQISKDVMSLARKLLRPEDRDGEAVAPGQPSAARRRTGLGRFISGF